MNFRPFGPEPNALAKLSYAPFRGEYISGRPVSVNLDKTLSPMSLCEQSTMRCRSAFAFSVMIMLVVSVPLAAADPTAEWPQWHGPKRDRVWPFRDLPPTLPNEFPTLWKKAIGGGFGGVAVAGGRVYVMDRQTTPREVERVVCLNLDTGDTAWVREYPVKYGSLDYGNGPRATPTIHDGKVYTLGAVGHLHCLNAKTGDIVWSHDCVKEFKAKLPTWGLACSPLVDGDRVLVQIGAEDGCLAVFNRTSGTLAWKALADRAGYATPLRLNIGKNKLVIMWTAENINGLNAETGARLWNVPFAVTYDVAISDPVWHDAVLLCSQYWEGSKALKLDPEGLNPTVIWEGKRLRQLMATPLVRDGHAYALDRENGLMCIELKTGKVKWDGFKVSADRHNPHASLVWTGDGRAAIVNDKGELIVAKLAPDKFEELGRRKLFAGSWSHPAFAGKHIVLRDDKVIVCVRVQP